MDGYFLFEDLREMNVVRHLVGMLYAVHELQKGSILIALQLKLACE